MRKASFSSTRSSSSMVIPARARTFRTAGIGPMPITRGSTPATALATKRPSGSTPSARAFSSLATTSAAAPSLIPLALPAVTVPSRRKAGFSVASFSAVVSGRGCSSRASPSTERSSVSKRPASTAAAQRCCERRPAHRLDAAGDEEVAVAGDDGVARGDDRGQPGGAEPVDGDAGNMLGQAREEDGHACDVAVVLAGLVRAAEVDILDLVRGDPRALDRLPHDERRQVVGAHARESAAVPADRRANAGEDDLPTSPA